VTRAHTIMVFDYHLDPDTVEVMTVSRLYKYLGMVSDLNKDRKEQGR
jgi:hypothetical protein